MEMTTIAISKARMNLYKLLAQVASSHEPVQITGKHGNGVLIAEDDWNSMQETLYLMSLPGMRKSIRQGLKTPVKKCVKELPW